MTSLAEKTSGFVFSDLLELARAAWEIGAERLAKRFPGFSPDSGVKVGASDFEAALKRLHSTIADSLGAPKIPSVRWSDVGKCSMTYSLYCGAAAQQLLNRVITESR
jgi:peroxin-6